MLPVFAILVWPLTVVVLVLLFRRRLLSLIEDVQRAKVKDIEIEFGGSKPAAAAVEAFHKRAFANETVILDDKYFEDCTFEECTLVFRAEAPFQMIGCTVRGGSLRYDHS